MLEGYRIPEHLDERTGAMSPRKDLLNAAFGDRSLGICRPSIVLAATFFQRRWDESPETNLRRERLLTTHTKQISHQEGRCCHRM